MSADNVTLLVFAAEHCVAGCPAKAAVDRHLLSTGPTAANPPHTAGEQDSQVDRETDRRLVKLLIFVDF